MSDQGSDGYVSVNPDGTVVVPSNMTVGGLIVAGDLATHADLDASATATYNAVVSDYDLADVIHDPGELDVFHTVKVDTIGGADLGALQFGPPRSIPVHIAGGNLTASIVSGGPYGELDAAAEWTPVGYLGLANGVAAVGDIVASGDHLNVTIVSLSTGLQAIDGNYFFRLLWHA
jgi:hypothetical protein